MNLIKIFSQLLPIIFFVLEVRASEINDSFKNLDIDDTSNSNNSNDSNIAINKSIKTSVPLRIVTHKGNLYEELL